MVALREHPQFPCTTPLCNDNKDYSVLFYFILKLDAKTTIKPNAASCFKQKTVLISRVNQSASL